VPLHCPLHDRKSEPVALLPARIALEYEKFSIRNTNGANLLSLGVFLNLH
jgi:hypothetical protein